MGVHFALQVFTAQDFTAPNGVGLQVMPYLFSRVELGAIRRQEEELELAAIALLALLDQLRFMHGMTIQNQKDGTFGSIHEPAHKLAHLFPTHPAPNHHETQQSLGADRRKQVQTKAD